MFESFYPAPFWRGPYSPRRGFNTDLTIRGRQLILRGDSAYGSANWIADKEEDAIFDLIDRVCADYDGGHIKIYPTGHVIKPLRENETGKRKCVGRLSDVRCCLRFLHKDHELSAESFRQYSPGDPVPIPFFGMEAILKPNGSLVNYAEMVTDYGREKHNFMLAGADSSLVDGFREARGCQESGQLIMLA